MPHLTTFEQALSEGSWTEILQGNNFIAFDIVAVDPVFLYFNSVDDADPDANSVANVIRSQPNRSWDFEGSGMEAPAQQIWAKGKNTIRGVRG